MDAGIRLRSRYVLTAVVLGALAWPAAAGAGVVLLSQERVIRNPNAIGDSTLTPVISAPDFEAFDESIIIEQEFDGSFDPATGRDSTITSISSVAQASALGDSLLRTAGFGRVYFNNTHSQGPFEARTEVESVFDVTFRVDRAHEFDLSASADLTGPGAEFELVLETADGDLVSRFVGEVEEGEDGFNHVAGVLMPGVYRLRQTARAETLNVNTVAEWDVNLAVQEQTTVIPLPPAAMAGLAMIAPTALAAARFRRRRA